MRRHSLHISLAAVVSLSLATACKTTDEPAEQPLLLFPPPPAEPRVQFLTWASGAAEVAEEITSFERMLLGEEETRFENIVKPYGVAAKDGVVYVCDTKGYNLARLDFKNRTYSVMGTQGLGRLRKPLNVVVDQLGYKFVVDSHRKQVVVFGPDDEFATAFDIPEPCKPVDAAIYGGELYVLDNDDSPQIVVLSRKSGEFLRSFGSAGTKPGEFNIPNSLCIDSEGYLYVSDSLNFRIQKMTREGEPVWQRGEPGRRLGQFGRPRGIRVGPDGIVYLVEGAMQLVQVFDSEGQVLMRFGGPGNVPGAMVLPSTLAVDATSIPYFQEYIHEDFNAEYLLFVANQYGGHLINVYAFGSFPEGYRFGDAELASLPETDEGTGIAPANEYSESSQPDGGAQDEEGSGNR